MEKALNTGVSDESMMTALLAKSEIYIAFSASGIDKQDFLDMHNTHLSLVQTAIRDWLQSEWQDPQRHTIDTVCKIWCHFTAALPVIAAVFTYEETCMRMLRCGIQLKPYVLGVFESTFLSEESVQQVLASSITDGLLTGADPTLVYQCIADFPLYQATIKSRVLETVRRHYDDIDTFEEGGWIDDATKQLVLLTDSLSMVTAVAKSTGSICQAVLQQACDTLVGRHFAAVSSMFEQAIYTHTSGGLFQEMDASFAALVKLCTIALTMAERTQLSAILDNIMAVRLRQTLQHQMQYAFSLFHWIAPLIPLTGGGPERSRASHLAVVSLYFNELGADNAAAELARFIIKEFCMKQKDEEDEIQDHTLQVLTLFVCALQSQDTFVATLNRQLTKMCVYLWAGRVKRADLALHRANLILTTLKQQLPLNLSSLDVVLEDLRRSLNPPEKLQPAAASSLAVLTGSKLEWKLRDDYFQATILPVSYVNLVDNYTARYRQHYPQRLLKWYHALTTCEICTAGGRKGLTVSLLQYIVLQCLGDHTDAGEKTAKRACPRPKSSLSLARIKETTGISDPKPVLLSLIVADVVAVVQADDDEEYALNMAARAWRTRRNVSTCVSTPLQEEKAEPKESIERNYQLQLLIIRTLKKEVRCDNMTVLFDLVCRLNSSGSSGSILITREQFETQLGELVKCKYAMIQPDGSIIYIS